MEKPGQPCPHAVGITPNGSRLNAAEQGGSLLRLYVGVPMLEEIK